MDATTAEKKWDRFSNIFQYYNEPQTLPIAHILLSNLRLNLRDIAPARAILEVACGAGASTLLCASMKHPQSEYTAVDVSTNMLSQAKNRLAADCRLAPGSKSVEFQQANAEKLTFADGAFDRYFSNYCLHLVADPDAMLAESYRVLEKGGVAAFSVWGRPENSLQFTITKKMAQVAGITMPVSSAKTPFHLNDINQLKEMARKAGFSSVQGGYTFNNALIANGNEFVEIFFAGPETQDLLATIDPAQAADWKQKTAEHVDALLAEGTFVGLESAYIVCTK
eukprot:gene2521-2882_t